MTAWTTRRHVPESRDTSLSGHADWPGAAAAVVAAGPLGACGAAQRLAPLPPKLRNSASFNGLPSDTRLVLDASDDGRLARTAMAALRRELDDAMPNVVDIATAASSRTCEAGVYRLAYLLEAAG